MTALYSIVTSSSEGVASSKERVFHAMLFASLSNHTSLSILRPNTTTAMCQDLSGNLAGFVSDFDTASSW
jgi:hypothetical protein